MQSWRSGLLFDSAFKMECCIVKNVLLYTAFCPYSIVSSLFKLTNENRPKTQHENVGYDIEFSHVLIQIHCFSTKVSYFCSNKGGIFLSRFTVILRYILLWQPGLECDELRGIHCFTLLKAANKPYQLFFYCLLNKLLSWLLDSTRALSIVLRLFVKQ